MSKLSLFAKTSDYMQALQRPQPGGRRYWGQNFKYSCYATQNTNAVLYRTDIENFTEIIINATMLHIVIHTGPL